MSPIADAKHAVSIAVPPMQLESIKSLIELTNPLQVSDVNSLAFPPNQPGSILVLDVTGGIKHAPERRAQQATDPVKLAI
jgi:hypothetical protein